MKNITKKLISAVLVLAMMLAMVTVASAEPDYVWLEAEDGDITGYITNDTPGTSGGEGVLLENTSGAAGQVEWEFDIAETGTYDIKILTSAGNVSHLSKYKWSLDGSDPAYNNNAAIGERVYTAGMLMTSQNVSWFPITSVTLDAGTHTMAISCDEKRTLANDWISHFFDCVAIVPADWAWTPDGIEKPEVPENGDGPSGPQEPVETEWLDLEAEEGTLKHNAVIDNASASGGKYVMSGQASAGNTSTMSFSRESAGTYDIWAAIAVASKDYLCEYEFSLDGGATFYDKNMKAAYNESVGSAFYTTADFVSGHNADVKWVKVGSAIEIGAGNHTILAEVGKEHASSQNAVINGGNSYGAIDKIRLVPSSWNYTPADLTTEPEEPQGPVVVDVTGFEIEEATLEMNIGDHIDLTYEVLPADATNKEVTWVSSASAVAAVAGGTITALSAGEATITGTTADGSFTDTCVVTVAGEDVAQDEGMVWLEAENAIISGTGYTIGNNGDASGGKLFQTQKNDADPITLTMLYEIEEAGEYAIKILASESHPMHLTKYKVKIDGGEAANVPSTTNAIAYNHYIAGATLPAKWHNIATMNLAGGTHTIEIILDEKRSLANDMMLAFIDVVGVVPTDWDWDVTTSAKPQAPVAVEEIDIIETALEMRGGDSFELTYEVYPENASVRDIVWSSSNVNVATVENGVVTAIAGGTATITAKSKVDDTIYDTCEVTVLAAKVNSSLVKIANVTNTNQPGVGTNNGIVQVGTAQEEGTVYTFDIPFTAPEEGVYDIYYTGSQSGVSHASPYKEYKIDGESKGVPTNSSHFASYGYANEADSTLDVIWYKLDQLELDTNEHTLTFVFDSPRSLDSSYMFALEYLLLVPAGTELKLNSTKESEGAKAAANLAEVLLSGIFIEETETTKDLLLHMNTIDGTEVVWTSSHPGIIDERGTVTRPGYYEEDAEVTLTASIQTTKRGETVTSTKEFVVKVPKKDEYSVEGFEIAYGDGGCATTAYVSENTGAEGKTAVLVLAHYDANGAMIGVDTDAITLTGELQQLSAELSGELLAGETVEAFIWTDLVTKELIEGSIITYGN